MSPIICFLIEKNQKYLFGDYQIGLELLVINGLLTFIGLMLISKPADGRNMIPQNKS